MLDSRILATFSCLSDGTMCAKPDIAQENVVRIDRQE